MRAVVSHASYGQLRTLGHRRHPRSQCSSCLSRAPGCFVAQGGYEEAQESECRQNHYAYTRTLCSAQLELGSPDADSRLVALLAAKAIGLLAEKVGNLRTRVRGRPRAQLLWKTCARTVVFPASLGPTTTILSGAILSRRLVDCVCLNAAIGQCGTEASDHSVMRPSEPSAATHICLCTHYQIVTCLLLESLSKYRSASQHTVLRDPRHRSPAPLSASVVCPLSQPRARSRPGTSPAAPSCTALGSCSPVRRSFWRSVGTPASYTTSNSVTWSSLSLSTPTTKNHYQHT